MSRGAERARRIVCQVVRAALRDTGAEGIVVAAPPSPPGELLWSWLREEDVPAASFDEVEARAGELGFTAGSDPELHRAAARVLARRRNLIPVHPIHKTALLIGRAPPPEPLLPLADVFASELSRWCGPVPRPPALQDRGDNVIERVDRALERYLEERLPWPRAASELDGDLRDTVKEALDRGRWYRLWSPVTPKLGDRTWGIDLDV